ncbi:unnamed protein product, partial [Didymodactylos carnosus]
LAGAYRPYTRSELHIDSDLNDQLLFLTKKKRGKWLANELLEEFFSIKINLSIKCLREFLTTEDNNKQFGSGSVGRPIIFILTKGQREHYYS